MSSQALLQKSAVDICLVAGPSFLQNPSGSYPTNSLESIKYTSCIKVSFGELKMS